MGSKTETETRVKLYRRGQSVRHVTTDQIGVIVHADVTPAGVIYQLAVWPCARLQARGAELAALSAADACARVWAIDGNGATNRNRCRPRARDGRCHFCEHELSSSEEEAQP